MERKFTVTVKMPPDMSARQVQERIFEVLLDAFPPRDVRGSVRVSTVPLKKPKEPKK
jgi:hypothetical protein